MELVTARVTVSTPTETGRVGSGVAAGTAARPSGSRDAYFDGAWQQTPVYRRELIPSECPLAGPLIIEQLDTTIIVLPGQRCTHDSFGFLHIQEQETP